MVKIGLRAEGCESGLCDVLPRVSSFWRSASATSSKRLSQRRSFFHGGLATVARRGPSPDNHMEVLGNTGLPAVKDGGPPQIYHWSLFQSVDCFLQG